MDPEHGGGDGGGDGGGGGGMSEWSSTIGIVTAIIGNVLISFALNIQRYAHIRISREQEHERLELGVQGRGSLQHTRVSSSGDYGTLTSSPIESHDSLRTITRSGVGRPDGNRAHNVIGGDHTQSKRRTSTEDSYIDDPDQMQDSFLSDRSVDSIEKSPQNGDRKSYLRSPYWWAGLILMTVGEAGNFLAYGFAPASIVSPLGVVALISNCVIAPFMLKEKFRQRDLWGVLVAVAGAVTVVLSAKTREVKIGPGEIWGMITTWEFEVYLGLTIGLILTLMWISQKYGRKTILIDIGLVGLFGGYTALSTKGVSSLLSYTLWHVITFPITYVLVAVLVFSAMMQIRYINRALQRFDSTQVIPTQFVLFTLSVITGSAVLYRDFESATLSQGLKFIGGCALTFFGVYLITSGRDRDVAEDVDEDVDFEAGDEEQRIGLLDGQRYTDHLAYSDHEQPLNQHMSDHGAAGTPRRTSTSHPHAIEEDLEDDDRIHAPRAHLSSSASTMPSISDTSSLIKSGPHSPRSFPANPWSSSSQDGGAHAAAEPATIAPLPGTPPPEVETPTVLLRFPSAPGLTESQSPKAPRTPTRSPSRSSPRKPDTVRSRLRGSFGSKTPLAIRFSPGPLLPPLSGGLSAVVAESLRRGEGSPDKRRTPGSSRKQSVNRRKTAPVLTGRPEGDAVYESDDGEHAGSGAPPQQEQFGGHLDRTGLLRRISGLQSASRANSQDIIRTVPFRAGDQGRADTQRGRSLSDTWSESLGRLGDSLRAWGRRQTGESIPPSPPHDA